MHRENFLLLLNSYNPKDCSETLFKKQFIQFVIQNTNCFDRSLEIGHITASCWLLNNIRSHALLMHHSKLDKWFQLGGHCDGDPDVLAVAIKEATEESGIKNIQYVNPYIFDLDIHLIPENKKEKAHYHYDVRFLLQSTEDAKIIQNSESKGLMWISKEDPLPTDNLSVVRMLKKWKEIPI